MLDANLNTFYDQMKTKNKLSFTRHDEFKKKLLQALLYGQKQNSLVTYNIRVWQKQNMRETRDGPTIQNEMRNTKDTEHFSTHTAW